MLETQSETDNLTHFLPHIWIFGETLLNGACGFDILDLLAYFMLLDRNYLNDFLIPDYER